MARSICRLYLGFRLKLDEITEMIIIGSLLTTFEASSIFEAAGAASKIKQTNQVKVIKIHNTHFGSAWNRMLL